MKKIFEIIQGLFSLDEEKSSIVVYIMVAVSVIGLIKTYQTGDFPNNLLVLLQFLVGSTMAYNVGNNIATKVSDTKVKKAELEAGAASSQAAVMDAPVADVYVEDVAIPEVPADFKA